MGELLRFLRTHELAWILPILIFAAVRYDLVPWRGNDATNDVVHAVAAELSGVVLVDAEA
jgi:hypothetical protein